VAAGYASSSLFRIVRTRAGSAPRPARPGRADNDVGFPERARANFGATVFLFAVFLVFFFAIARRI
jgi:hypothetical protein